MSMKFCLLAAGLLLLGGRGVFARIALGRLARPFLRLATLKIRAQSLGQTGRPIGLGL
ncbi:hypothetical protein KHP62_17400 [Rhodobacteraceae bacterium NNCM2]|nr:hypothetical protein [Coraliihabitans acroporae]